MFGIGLPELVIIFVVALFAIGPDKLPGVIKSLAKFIAEFKRTANHLKHQVEEEVHRMSEEADIKQAKQDVTNSVKEIRSAVQLFQSPQPPAKLISTFTSSPAKTSDVPVSETSLQASTSSVISSKPGEPPEKNHA